MQLRFKPDMSALSRQALTGGVWLFALALTAWILASWYWYLNGTPVQSARPAPTSDPIAAAQDIASRQLFGTVSAMAPAATLAATPDLVVTGVSTQWGKLSGYAVISKGSAPADAFVEGEEIAPGIKLVHVLSDGIEIDRNGTREKIKLSSGSHQVGNTPTNAGPQQGNATPPAPTTPAPAGTDN